MNSKRIAAALNTVRELFPEDYDLHDKLEGRLNRSLVESSPKRKRLYKTLFYTFFIGISLLFIPVFDYDPIAFCLPIMVIAHLIAGYFSPDYPWQSPK